MASKSNFSVAIDIGTSKLCAIAGHNNENGKIEVLGSASVPAQGIKRGIVINIDEATEAVERLLHEIGQQVGGKIKTVDIAFAGQQVKITEYKGYRYISGEGVVIRSDLDALYEEVKNLQTDKEFTTIHIIPQTFVVDGEPADLNPVGMTGQKMEATFKLISVPETHIANFRKVLAMSGAELGEVVLSPLAAAEAALTGDEKEMGAILLDIGAGTTKLAVYNQGIMTHAAVIPFAGNVVTHDIREGCSILPKWAEQLKIQYGQALGDFADGSKVVTIPGHSGWEPKEISFKSLAFIIQARIEEIIDSVYYQIEKSGVVNQLGSGIVISGGTAGLQNLISLIKYRTGMDARLGYPVLRTEDGLPKNTRSEYITALGLLKLALDKTKPVTKKRVKQKRENKFSPWLKEIVQGVINYIDDDDDVALK